MKRPAFVGLRLAPTRLAERAAFAMQFATESRRRSWSRVTGPPRGFLRYGTGLPAISNPGIPYTGNP